jgi:hypothetical protein
MSSALLNINDRKEVNGAVCCGAVVEGELNQSVPVILYYVNTMYTSEKGCTISCREVL